MDDEIIITRAERTVLKYHRIWSEDVLESTGFKCLQLYDSISQEEYRRFVDLKIIDDEGFIMKSFPLPKLFIRPRTSV